MAEAEVIVIGGGIVGTSAAFHLAEHGRDVTLLEKGDIASEASGQNGGAIGALGWGNTPNLDSYLTMSSLEIFRSLQLDLDYDIEFRQSGSLSAIQTEDEYEYARYRVQGQRAQGYNVELLNTKDGRAIEPEASPDLKGFIYMPLRSQADPVKATKALAYAAAGNGANILTGHTVTAIQQGGDGAYLVETDKGNFQAETLVIAAGAWCGPIGQMLGLNIPITPVRGQMWATKSLPPRVFQTLSASESSLEWESNPGENPPWLTHRNGPRITRHLYGRQRRNGEIIFGGDRELVSFDKRLDPSGIEVNKEHASEILPLLKDLPINRTWSGLMPFSPDGAPIIGKIPQRDNLYIVSGLCSSGFGRGPMAGRLVADYIHTGQMTQVLLEADPSRCITEAD